MTVFHGSNSDFDTVSLDFAKDRRDFGRGFYTTTIKEQAESWAESICKRYTTNTAYLYEFEFSFTGLTVKTFDEISKEWLEFIIANRIKGGTRHDYDVVMGPVANDRTINTLNLYFDGEYTLEEAMKRLSYMQANNQIVIHTEKALDNLTFTRRTEWKL
ncbi:MAG: DUF3990 domain-containing protein [Spirochaetaceae bacterium]|jgi:hypothetical protein|nr:DUF3990 domain-containing protein [Spirochaetaceae bacterium]